MSRAGTVALVSAALAALAAAGCGVRTDASPQRIAASTVPYHLLDPSAPPPTTGPAQASVRIWLVRGTHVVPATANAPYPGRADQAVRALLAGVSTAQSDRGLRSAVPAGTHLISYDLDGDVARLDLSSEFTDTAATDQVLAVAQLVCTAAQDPRVDRVALAVDGHPVELPRPDGSITDQPVRPSDYDAVVGSA